MESIEWGEYKLGDLFEKISVKSLKYKTSELPSERKNEFILPALTAGIQNQGLNNYVPIENATILQNVISISANGANTGATFYQSKEFTVLQDAYAIKWIYSDDKLNDNHYLFLVGSISKTIFGNYEWTNKAGWEKIKNDKIKLPIKNNKIYFDFMESFVSELEAEKISELEAYLLATGLNEYELTAEERQALEEFESNKLEFKNYNLNELFDVLSSVKRFDANKITILENGEFPYVVRTSLNNGQRGFIVEDKTCLNNGNTISFGQDTATMFYQEVPYFTGDKIKILKPKNEKFNKTNAHFFITTMTKSFSSFSWGSTSFNVDIIKKQQISLPISENKEINYKFMETVISAIQKMIIKDVAIYNNEKLKARKSIIEN